MLLNSTHVLFVGGGSSVTTHHPAPSGPQLTHWAYHCPTEHNPLSVNDNHVADIVCRHPTILQTSGPTANDAVIMYKMMHF